MGERLWPVIALVTLVACSDKKTEKQSPAGNHVDPRITPFRAGLEAPEGKTPCESAYNAYRAGGEAAQKAGLPLPWKQFPDRDRFLALCDALPEKAQICLIPKYQGDPEKCAGMRDWLAEAPEAAELRVLLAPADAPVQQVPAGAGVEAVPASE